MVHVKQLSKENERIAVPGEPHSRKRLQKVEYLNMEIKELTKQLVIIRKKLRNLTKNGPRTSIHIERGDEVSLLLRQRKEISLLWKQALKKRKRLSPPFMSKKRKGYHVKKCPKCLRSLRTIGALYEEDHIANCNGKAPKKRRLPHGSSTLSYGN